MPSPPCSHMDTSNLTKVENLLLNFPGYNCFACSPSHSWGFRLEFYHDPAENVVLSPLSRIKEEMAGFPGLVHGGFQAMLLDEMMCWAVMHFERKLVFTARMEIKFSRALNTSKPCVAKGRVLKAGKKLITAEAWIDSGGTVRVYGTGSFIVPRPEDFRSNLGTDSVPAEFLDYLRT